MSLAHIVRQTALILGLVFAVIMTGQAISTAIAPLSALSEQTGATPQKTQSTVPMQYRSGGHVLGFTSEGVLIAGRDHLLKVSFINAAAVAPQTGETATEPSASNDQGAAPLNEVHYRNLWPSIDLRYDGQDGIVRSTYTLGVGAKVEAIRLAYNVATALTDQGSVTLTFATGTLQETAPIAWQEIDGERHPVTVAFHRHKNGELGFTLGDYDPAHPVIIDPTLTWNTFLGGAGTDVGLGIAAILGGDVYVTGNSTATWGAPVRPYTAVGDAFVAKLNATTGALAWNTFLGGAGNDLGNGIAIDNPGDVYVTGRSDATWGAPVRPYTAGTDAFVAKLSGANGVLIWNTFLGGAGDDVGYGIATDGFGDVYVTGGSTAAWGGPMRSYTAGQDAFVAKLNGAAGWIAWITFLGGTGDDYGAGIATDGSGNVYVTGHSTNTWGAPVRPFDVVDAFVAQLSATSGVLAWNTFLGGTGDDTPYGIATDGIKGNVYVTGHSTASWGAPVRAYGGGVGYDAFAAKLNGATGVLTWNTFLGGSGGDIGRGIASDGWDVYVTGESTATWGAPARAYTGGYDAFVAKLNGTTGVLTWNTFLGGAGDDVGAGIAIDGWGDVYVTGWSDAAWGAPMRAYAGGFDAFVAKIVDDIRVPTGPNSFACTPAPSAPVLSSSSDDAQPLFVSNPGVTDVLVGLAFSGFAGAVDIYVAVVLPSSQILIHDTAPSVNWLPYPPAVSLRPASAAAVTMTSIPTNNLYYNPVSSSVPPGLYTSYVVVVPAGTNPATFNFASSPHYTWCNTRTFP